MRILRPAAERGISEFGWLHSRHSFSFGGYADERWQGFRSLLVINDDVVEPGQGFGTHGHRDMEIVTWVLDGALEHRDSLGNGGILRHGDVQVMSAGTGIRHSEYNASQEAKVHFLQMWIQPDAVGVRPNYAQAVIPDADRHGRWATLAAGAGRPAAVAIAADAAVLVASLDAGRELGYPISPGRHAWLQIASGSLIVDGQGLATGDGLAVSEEDGLHLSAGAGGAEVVLFDLP